MSGLDTISRSVNIDIRSTQHRIDFDPAGGTDIEPGLLGQKRVGLNPQSQYSHIRRKKTAGGLYGFY